MNTYIVCFHIENQFVHPSPKGSELIFLAPFRAGVNKDKSVIGKNADNQLFFKPV